MSLDFFLVYLVQFAEKALAGLAQWILDFFPQVYRGALFSSVGVDELAASLIGFLVVMVIVLSAHNIIKHHIRWKSPNEPEHWKDGILVAINPPVHFLIWVLGFYLALSPVLTNIPQGNSITTLAAAFVKFALFAAFYWFLFRMVCVVDAWVKKQAQRTGNAIDDALAPLLGQFLHFFVPITAIIAAREYFSFPEQWQKGLSTLIVILIILSVAWVLTQLTKKLDQIILSKYRIDIDDNLQARKIHTQVRVLQRISFFLIGLFTAASILMLFQSVRQFGASILASAGVVGIIIGFAAQRTIANLFAGIQLAFTQPIRLDDVVIVENEWGRIEDITLTYVVVCIWDLRRLILPISYFIEKPFQNWTRVSAEILGTVYLYMDYTVPVDEIRKELKKIVKNNPLWNGKVCGVQITDTKKQTVEVRALISAADASQAWDLRCEVREKLIAFIREKYPHALPKLRARLSDSAKTEK